MKTNDLNNVGIILKLYYQQAEQFLNSFSYKEWLNTLDKPMKDFFMDEGFFDCRDVLAYRRFCLESNGIYQEEFLKKNLSSQELSKWNQLNLDGIN